MDETAGEGGMRAKLRPVRWETELEQSEDVKNGVNQRAAALLEAEEEATSSSRRRRRRKKKSKWIINWRKDGRGYARMLAEKTQGGFRKMVFFSGFFFRNGTYMTQDMTDGHADRRTHRGKKNKGHTWILSCSCIKKKWERIEKERSVSTSRFS